MVGKGAGAHVRQSVERRRLGRCRRVWGDASLGLDLVMQGDGLQRERHDGLGLQLGDGDPALGCCQVGQGGDLALRLFAGPPAVLRSVSDQLVQLLCVCSTRSQGRKE